MRKIKVINKPIGMDPIEMTIPDVLRSYQTLVDGPIEVVCVNIDGIDGLMLVNEEGKLRGDLQFNFTFDEVDEIYGDVVFVGYAGEEFANCPFNIQQVKEFTKQ